MATTEAQKNFGALVTQAIREPVSTTKHTKEVFVIMFDTNLFIYTVEVAQADNPFFASIKQLFARAETGEIQALISELSLAETSATPAAPSARIANCRASSIRWINMASPGSNRNWRNARALHYSRCARMNLLPPATVSRFGDFVLRLGYVG